MKTINYKQAASTLNKFTAFSIARIDRQKDADNSVLEAINRYGRNDRNSISGDAFKQLVDDLRNAQNDWHGYVDIYLHKIGSKRV